VETHAKTTLSARAAGNDGLGRFLIFIGVVGVIAAVILGLVTVNDMSDAGSSFFGDDEEVFSTADKIVAFSTVTFGLGMPSLLLIGLGKLLTAVADWFTAYAAQPMATGGAADNVH
jgi:hypothetical protein